MTRQTSTTPDFYEILNIPFPGPSTTPFPKQQLKIAYHKALLKYHPDKAPSANAIAQEQATTTTSFPLPSSGDYEPSWTQNKPITIGEITTAYKTLSDATLRAEYDRSLRLDRSRLAEREKNGGAVFHTGLEVVDLEDLACDEDSNPEGGDIWYRGCRCGDERGFSVSERDLEREAEHGEIVVGCRGCSLWMKVLFAVEDDDYDYGNDNGDGQKT